MMRAELQSVQYAQLTESLNLEGLLDCELLNVELPFSLQFSNLTNITTMSPFTKGILCIYRVVNLPMDLISADHTAEVRSSTAESLIKAFVQSFGWTMVPVSC